MSITKIKKQATINRIKFTFVALCILVINVLLVFKFLTVAQSPPASGDFIINLNVCIKGEDNNLVKTDEKKFFLTILGGLSPYDMPYDAKTGCSPVDKNRKFTSAKKYVILARFQGPSGVKMSTRFFDPSLYAINAQEPNKAPGIIEIPIKDGVSIFDKNGNLIYPGNSGANDPDNIKPVNTDNSNIANNANDLNNSNKNVSGNPFSYWGNIVTFLSFPILLILLLRQFVHFSSQENETGLNKNDLLKAKEEIKSELSKAANLFRPSQIDFPTMLETIRNTILEEKMKHRLEIDTGKDFTSSTVESLPNTLPPDLSAGTGVRDRQMRDAQMLYQNMAGGMSIRNCLELQPTGETSPEHMVGQQGIILCEQKGGKYVAFALSGDQNEAWVFPAVKFRFNENPFSLLFPDLTKEDYELGNITPRKAVKRNINTWLIL